MSAPGLFRTGRGLVICCWPPEPLPESPLAVGYAMPDLFAGPPSCSASRDPETGELRSLPLCRSPSAPRPTRVSIRRHPGGGQIASIIYKISVIMNLYEGQAGDSRTGRPRARTNLMRRARTAPLRATAWLVSSGCSRRFQRARVEALGVTGWRGRRVGVWATLAWCGATGTR
jgi:hypothetical protein